MPDIQECSSCQAYFHYNSFVLLTLNKYIHTILNDNLTRTLALPPEK